MTDCNITLADSQAELFPADPPARGIDNGGYTPGQTVNWRGHEIPKSYLFDEGFKVVRRPTDIELLDMIMSAVEMEPVGFRQLCDISGRTVFLVSKHLDLLRELELVADGPWIAEQNYWEIRMAKPEETKGHGCRYPLSKKGVRNG